MMTPSELRNYEFKGAGRNAYKADDVDNFFGEVSVAYEKIFRENAELIKRVGLLADRLEQLKKDEEQIKQAVIGAQKAADIIVKEAENSVEESKIEAEAILAAAKGEAEIIKSDAEKQAVADSDLLLSIARDKAEEIINKAKEEAHGIIIDANDSAKDTVGAATRTITSESLHYEMLKKEVSDFRASILAQYKAHIEMISKLPELAAEEAEKESEVEKNNDTDSSLVEDIQSVDPDNDIIEFISDEEDSEETEVFQIIEEPDEVEDVDSDEEVVKTTLPYDFFEENSTLEFVSENDEVSETDDVVEVINDVDFSANETLEDTESAETDESKNSDVAFENEEKDEKDEKDEKVPEDIAISKGFSVNFNNIEAISEDSSESDNSINSLFASFETIDDNRDDEDNEAEATDKSKKKRGFFRRK